MEILNSAEAKLAEAKELLALSDKCFEEGNIEKAKEYLYLAPNASQSSFTIATEDIKKLSQKIDGMLKKHKKRMPAGTLFLLLSL